MYNKREVLVGELGQLKDKYSQLEQTFTELKKQAALHETQGLVPVQEIQVQLQQEQEDHEQGQTS
ncbi:MAG: hypothetical protein P4L59_15930 [Desulfosporosinus sp.]|nr:hypothetical protein [Desulfosporosinus sp.]